MAVHGQRGNDWQRLSATTTDDDYVQTLAERTQRQQKVGGWVLCVCECASRIVLWITCDAHRVHKFTVSDCDTESSAAVPNANDRFERFGWWPSRCQNEVRMPHFSAALAFAFLSPRSFVRNVRRLSRHAVCYLFFVSDSHMRELIIHYLYWVIIFMPSVCAVHPIDVRALIHTYHALYKFRICGAEAHSRAAR